MGQKNGITCVISPNYARRKVDSYDSSLPDKKIGFSRYFH